MSVLLMFQASLSPIVTKERFNDWYDNEHFAERCKLPGVLSAARYIRLVGIYEYLALYVLSDLSVLDAPAYGALWHSPLSALTMEMAGRVRSFRRQVLTPDVPNDVAGNGASPIKLSNNLIALHVDPLLDADGRLKEWCKSEYIPELENICDAAQVTMWESTHGRSWWCISTCDGGVSATSAAYSKLVDGTARWNNWVDCNVMDESVYVKLTDDSMPVLRNELTGE